MSTNKQDGRTERAQHLREQRRLVILDAALRVFASRGFHAASISDIVEDAGVARGTFYLYFESKDAVFVALLEGLLDHLSNHIIGVELGADAPAIDKQLVATIRRVLETLRINRSLASILFREAVGLDQLVDKRMRGFYETLRGYIRISLEQGAAVGLVREIDFDFAATCILGSVKQVVEHHLVSDEASPFDVERWSRAIVDYNLHGLLQTSNAN